MNEILLILSQSISACSNVNNCPIDHSNLKLPVESRRAGLGGTGGRSNLAKKNRTTPLVS